MRSTARKPAVNCERHEHAGVTYFVSGGGAAHAYPIERAPMILFKTGR